MSTLARYKSVFETKVHLLKRYIFSKKHLFKQKALQFLVGIATATVALLSASAAQAGQWQVKFVIAQNHTGAFQAPKTTTYTLDYMNFDAVNGASFSNEWGGSQNWSAQIMV